MTVALISWMLSAHLNVFDSIVAFTHRHERWQLDEVITIILFLSIFAFVSTFLQSQRHLRGRRRAEQDAFVAARQDVLTGLPNRRMLLETASRAIRDALRCGSKCSVLFIELDGFKPVNDTYGHSAGDRVLTAVAERLTQVAPDGATVARLGGDEFAIFLPKVETEARVIQLAQTAITVLSDPIDVPGATVSISASVGLASGPEIGRRAEDLIHAADLAMYSAKRAGRGAVHIYRAQAEPV